MACLDTTVFIELSRSRSKHRAGIVSLLADLPTPAVTTRFNVAELLLGVELAHDSIAERQQVDAALAEIAILEFDEAAALQYAKLSAYVRRLGRPVADMDRLIAAVALANAEVLVTRNPKHFADIPGLVVLGY